MLPCCLLSVQRMGFYPNPPFIEVHYCDKYMCCARVDVFSLQKMMGHIDLQVLRRYLAQTIENIAQAHRIGSPVDN
jgi:hypothetical protein